MGILLIGFAEDRFTEAQRADIAQAAGALEVVYGTDQAAFGRYAADVEVLVENRRYLADFPNLNWFQQWGAGADWLLQKPELAARDFIITNVSGIHAVPISEHILAYLLAFARNLPQAVRDQQTSSWSHSWSEASHDYLELAGKTLLLLGTGAIGARTAQLAAAFEMQVVGVRRNPERGLPHVERMVALSDLHAVLPEADFVVLTLPLTRDTQHLIGEAELRLLKPGAYLVNIGRGGLIDEPALVRALEAQQLAGAGLDVFETEPLPEASPLWSFPNVIVTPHVAGDTPHYDERALEIFIDNLRRYGASEPLTHVVDKELGY